MSELLGRIREALADRYAIDSEIGRGGMAAVFLATDLKHQRAVAVKVMLPEVATSIGSGRFLREIRVAAELNHPHILPLHDSGETANGLLYYVMPYVEGESVRQRLAREGRLPISEAVSLTRQVALALGHAHERGYVHRDVKPANLLLSSGYALVSDFGIAGGVLAAGGEQLTQSGLTVGTPVYMAPEQVTGDRPVDGRCDQYALGCVLYELLTGTPPFTGDSAQAVLLRHAMDPVPSVRTVRDTVPEAVESVIRKALAKSPADRFQSMEAFAAALVSAEGSSVASGAGAAPTADARRRSRRVAALTTATVLLVALVGVLVLRGRLSPGSAYAVEDPRQSFLILPFSVASDDPQLTWLSDGAANMLGTGLEGWREVRVANPRHLLGLARARSIDLGDRVSLDDAFQLARDARVGTLVLGDITAQAGQAEFTVRVYDVSSRAELVEPVLEREAVGEDMRPAFDRISSQVLEISGAPEAGADLRAMTTSSLQAYQEYTRGVRHLYRWELEEAAALFREAVSADSTFALAHFRLALTLSYLPNDTTPLSPILAAAGRFDRSLHWRDRQHIEAFAALTDRDFVRARDGYRRLLASDSTDAEAWFHLGSVEYRDVREVFETATGSWQPRGNWNTALAAFLKAVDIDPEFHLGYGQAFQVYANVNNDYILGVETPAGLDVEWAGIYPAFEDTIRWAFLTLGNGTISGDSARLFDDSVARMFRVKGLALAKRWRDAAPGLAQPYEAMISLYMEEGVFSPTGDEARPVAEAARARLETVGDTTIDQLLRLGGLYLNIGQLDSAAHAILMALDAREDGRFPERGIDSRDAAPGTLSLIRWFPRQIWVTPYNLFAARGQRAQALKQLEESTDSVYAIHDGDVTYEIGPIRMQAWHVGANAIPGIDDSDLRESFRVLLESVVGRGSPEPNPALVANTLTEGITPALLAMGLPAIESWFEVATDTSREWRVWLAAHVDSVDRVDDALAWVRASSGDPEEDLSSAGLFVLASAATQMGRDSVALELLNLMEEATYHLAFPDVGYALRSRAHLVRAKLYESLGDTQSAREQYGEFLSVWADSEGREELEDAREALARLQESHLIPPANSVSATDSVRRSPRSR